MTGDPFEPIELSDLLRELHDRLKSFESAFKKGPTGVKQAVEIWEQTRALQVEWDRFHEFLKQYAMVIAGLLWAHYPEVYKGEIYARLREEFSEGEWEKLSAPPAHPPGQPRTMLDVAEEIFRERDNEPLSIPALIEQMKRKGVRFGAKDPAKSLGQTMRNSGRFESPRRGLYRSREQV